MNFVQTSVGSCDIIITVKTPNTLYSFATPHKKQEIPSPKKDSTPPPRCLFCCPFLENGCVKWAAGISLSSKKKGKGTINYGNDTADAEQRGIVQ